MNFREIISENIDNIVLDKIISEAISNTVNQQQAAAGYSQYANELRKYVGTSGIDSRPVQNNQAAKEHINSLNSFIFEVINAIDNNNIDSSSTLSSNSSSYSYYNPYRQNMGNALMDIPQGIVNTVGGAADSLVNSLNIPDNPLRGVFGAAVNGYNKTHNATVNLMNNMDYAKAYGGGRSSSSNTKNISVPLTTLMLSDGVGNPPRYFKQLYQQYQQINHTNGNILNTIPAVPQCYNILLNIAQNISQRNTSNKQANTGKNNTQNTNNTNPQNPGGTNPQNPGGGAKSTKRGQNIPNKPQINYKRYLLMLRNVNTNGHRLNVYMDKINNMPGLNTRIRNSLKNIVDKAWRLCDNCITAIENNSIYSNNITNGITPLQDLMSLNKNTMGNSEYFYDVYTSYYMYNQHYSGDVDREFPVLASMMETLRNLYNEMKKSGIFTTSNSTRRGGRATPTNNSRRTIARRR